MTVDNGGLTGTIPVGATGPLVAVLVLTSKLSAAGARVLDRLAKEIRGCAWGKLMNEDEPHQQSGENLHLQSPTCGYEHVV